MKKVIKNTLLTKLKEELSKFNNPPYCFVRSQFNVNDTNYYLETSYEFDTKKSNGLVEENNNELVVMLRMNLSRGSSLKVVVKLNENTKIDFDFVDNLIIETFKNNIDLLKVMKKNLDFVLLEEKKEGNN